MARASAVSHLKLVVTSNNVESSTAPRRPNREPVQLPLLLLPSPRLLGLVDMSAMPATPFVSLLKELRPRWVMDLRVIPLLDLGGTNRRWFFELFTQLGIQYRDVSGRLGTASSYAASLISGEVIAVLNTLLSQEPRPAGPGPVLVLLDGPSHLAMAEQILPSQLRPSPLEGWELHSFDARSLARVP